MTSAAAPSTSPILEIDDGLFEVKSTNGDTFLGGEDFDMRIVNYLADEFKKEHGVDLTQGQDGAAAAEGSRRKGQDRAVVRQPDRDQPAVHLDGPATRGQPLHLVLKLTRAKLESLVGDLIKSSMKPCGAALKDAGLSKADIDEVVLVGGMTRMPKVVEEVTKFFGKEPHKGVNPDEVVALGAAIQAGVLQGDVKDVVLLDVTPLSLGHRDAGRRVHPADRPQHHDPDQEVPDLLDRRGQPERRDDPGLPGRARDGGRQQDAGPVQPRTDPARAARRAADRGDLRHRRQRHRRPCSAKDKGTNKEQKITIQASGGLSDADIEKMVKEAEENAEADKERRELVEAKNQAESLIHCTEKSVDEHGDKVDPTTVEVIELAIKALKEAHGGRRRRARSGRAART